MLCVPAPNPSPFDESCDVAPKSLDDGAVFINALAASMPACDRAEGTRRLDQMEEAADRCFVYCAQHSCDAARTFMADNEEELRRKCKRVTYLPSGALSMPEHVLVDGRKCHADIVEHNKRATDDAKACLTCVPGRVTIGATFEGEPLNASYASTEANIPAWFVREGNYSPLPPIFHSDRRFHHPPELHERTDRPVLEIDLSSTDLPGDVTIGYWAARENDHVVEAGQAYRDFSESGIVRCQDGRCPLRVNYPGRYTAEGKVYRPHIHFAVWKGNEWDTVARTVEFSQ